MRGIILIIIYFLATSYIKKGKLVKPSKKFEDYKFDQDLKRRKNTFDSSVQRKEAQNKKQKTQNDLGSFLSNLEKALYPGPQKPKEDKSTYIFEKSRKTKRKENKSYSMEAEKLETEALQAQRLNDYEISLYGSDDENLMFDYDYNEINKADEDQDLPVFQEGSVSLNLREAVIMKEILDKPKALRKKIY
ncbi:MAG: hypothetical protein Q4E36_04410 [Bacillota bacterium]|nr:hypothetical protein [Bacillota bacterium]